MEGRNGRKSKRTRIRMLSLHISTQNNTDGETDRQTSKCLTSAVASWAEAEIEGKYCVLLPVRDLQDCSLWCTLPQTACADSSLMARVLYFLWLPHEENSCNCSKETVVMHSKMWIFYNLWFTSLAYAGNCELLYFPGKKLTHQHPTGYHDSHFNSLWNSSSNIGYCSNINVQKLLKIRMKNVDVWVKMVHTALSAAWSACQLFLNQSKEMPSYPFYTQTSKLHQRRHDCVPKVNSWLHVGF